MSVCRCTCNFLSLLSVRLTAGRGKWNHPRMYLSSGDFLFKTMKDFKPRVLHSSDLFCGGGELSLYFDFVVFFFSFSFLFRQFLSFLSATIAPQFLSYLCFCLFVFFLLIFVSRAFFVRLFLLLLLILLIFYSFLMLFFSLPEVNLWAISFGEGPDRVKPQTNFSWSFPNRTSHNVPKTPSQSTASLTYKIFQVSPSKSNFTTIPSLPISASVAKLY